MIVVVDLLFGCSFPLLEIDGDDANAVFKKSLFSLKRSRKSSEQVCLISPVFEVEAVELVFRIESNVDRNGVLDDAELVTFLLGYKELIDLLGFVLFGVFFEDIFINYIYLYANG